MVTLVYAISINDNLIEGRDIHHVPDQSKPHIPFVKELLDSATGKDADGNAILTIPDLSKISSKRRAEARRDNPDFSLSKFHAFFGSSKYVFIAPLVIVSLLIYNIH
jgi:hypothetical protein